MNEREVLQIIQREISQKVRQETAQLRARVDQQEAEILRLRERVNALSPEASPVAGVILDE
jgi:uncharacterized protein YhaN